MSTELAGKKALVVGASGGMGSDIAVALAREGIATASIGRNAETLAETANACAKAGAQAVSIVCDISQNRDARRSGDGRNRETWRVELSHQLRRNILRWQGPGSEP